MICFQKEHPTRKSPVTLRTIWDGKFKATAPGKGESYSGRPSTPADQRLKMHPYNLLLLRYLNYDGKIQRFDFYGYI